MPWTLQQYEDNRGLRPVNDFIESLTEADRAIVKVKLAFLLERGNQLREPFTKSLGNGLMELRAQSYRIFFCFRPGNRIVLLHALRKKSQTTPKRDMALARKRMQEV